MDPSWRLDLQVVCDGPRVASVAVDNRRPRASHLLQGLAPAEMFETVTRLFAVCRRSQRAAAELAWAAASGGGNAGADGRYDSAITVEALQEGLWRLMIDWPLLLGIEPPQATAVAWHRRLAAATQAGATELRRCGRDLLRGPVAQLLGSGPGVHEDADSEGDLTAGDGLLARMLAVLQPLEPPQQADPPAPSGPWVPTVDAVHTAISLQWPLDEAYCSAPRWDRQPSETGPLARRLQLPSLRRLLDAGRPIAARLAARALALRDDARRLASGDCADPPLCDATRLADGSGLARVETARGALIHWVRASEGRTGSYAIVAPTEWNFHPQGPFAHGARSARCDGLPALQRHLNALALSLDPCVEYGIGVRHA